MIWTAFILGVAMCATPGVVTAEAVRRGAQRGFAGALSLELGSLVGDAAWAVLALSGVLYLEPSRWASIGAGAVGAAFLLRLAGRALADAWTGAAPAPASSVRGDFGAGVLLSLSNPFQIGFWLGFGGTVAVMVRAQPDPAGPVPFFAAFMLAAFVWCLVFAAAVAWGRRYLGGPFYRCVNVLCGVALLYFAASVFGRLLRDLTQAAAR